jgi:hypothetical protein
LRSRAQVLRRTISAVLFSPSPDFPVREKAQQRRTATYLATKKKNLLGSQKSFTTRRKIFNSLAGQ